MDAFIALAQPVAPWGVKNLVLTERERLYLQYCFSVTKDMAGGKDERGSNRCNAGLG